MPAPDDAPRTPRPLLLVLRACVLLICLLVPVVFAPWRAEVFAPLKIQVLHALIGIGLLAMGMGVMLGRFGGTRFLPALDGAIVAFGAMNLLACAHSLDPASSWSGTFPEYQGMATILAYLIAYGLARAAFTVVPATRPDRGRRLRRKRVRVRPLDALFGALTVSTGLIGGYAVLQRLGLDPVWGFAERPFATVGQANSMAAMLVVGLPAAVASYAVRRGPARVASAVAIALGMLGLLSSLSRGGWLAALVAGVVGVVLHRPRALRGPLIAAVSFLVVLILGLAVLPSGRDAVARAGDRVTALGNTEAGSTGKHLALARVGVAVTLDHPWLGIGQEAFPRVAQQYADERLPLQAANLLRPRRSESPHNALLAISSAAGIPALLSFLTFLTAAARHLLIARRRGDTRAVPVLMILAGYVTSSLFMTAEVSSTVVLWAVLGAAGSAVGRPPHPCRRRAQDAGTPDRTAPDATRQHLDRPDQEQPDQGHPDQEHPDQGHPDQGHPDQEQLDQEQLDQGQPGGDRAEPGGAMPSEGLRPQAPATAPAGTARADHTTALSGTTAPDVDVFVVLDRIPPVLPGHGPPAPTDPFETELPDLPVIARGAQLGQLIPEQRRVQGRRPR